MNIRRFSAFAEDKATIQNAILSGQVISIVNTINANNLNAYEYISFLKEKVLAHPKLKI